MALFKGKLIITDIQELGDNSPISSWRITTQLESENFDNTDITQINNLRIYLKGRNQYGRTQWKRFSIDNIIANEDIGFIIDIAYIIEGSEDDYFVPSIDEECKIGVIGEATSINGFIALPTVNDDIKLSDTQEIRNIDYEVRDNHLNNFISTTVEQYIIESGGQDNTKLPLTGGTITGALAVQGNLSTNNVSLTNDGINVNINSADVLYNTSIISENDITLTKQVRTDSSVNNNVTISGDINVNDNQTIIANMSALKSIEVKSNDEATISLTTMGKTQTINIETDNDNIADTANVNIISKNITLSASNQLDIVGDTAVEGSITANNMFVTTDIIEDNQVATKKFVEDAVASIAIDSDVTVLANRIANLEADKLNTADLKTEIENLTFDNLQFADNQTLVSTEEQTKWNETSNAVETLQTVIEALNEAKDTYELKSEKGVANGYAPLNEEGKISSEFLYEQEQQTNNSGIGKLTYSEFEEKLNQNALSENFYIVTKDPVVNEEEENIEAESIEENIINEYSLYYITTYTAEDVEANELLTDRNIGEQKANLLGVYNSEVKTTDWASIINKPEIAELVEGKINISNLPNTLVYLNENNELLSNGEIKDIFVTKSENGYISTENFEDIIEEGNYAKVTVNSKGLVTSGTKTIPWEDITNIPSFVTDKITGDIDWETIINKPNLAVKNDKGEIEGLKIDWTNITNSPNVVTFDNIEGVNVINNAKVEWNYIANQPHLITVDDQNVINNAKVDWNDVVNVPNVVMVDENNVIANDVTINWTSVEDKPNIVEFETIEDTKVISDDTNIKWENIINKPNLPILNESEELEINWNNINEKPNIVEFTTTEDAKIINEDINIKWNNIVEKPNIIEYTTEEEVKIINEDVHINWDNVINKPNIATLNEENQLEVEWNNVNNKPNIVEFATNENEIKIINSEININWDNVVNKPNIALLNEENQLEVEWNNVNNKPNIVEFDTNENEIKVISDDTNIKWGNIIDKPNIATLNEENQLEVEWNNINEKPNIVEFTTTEEEVKIINADTNINWDNVINKPNIATLNEENQLEVEWDNVNNKPNIVEFATDENEIKVINSEVNINWDNIVNKPNIATLNEENQLEVEWDNVNNKPDMVEFTTIEDTKIINEDINIKWNNIVEKPNIVEYTTEEEVKIINADTNINWDNVINKPNIALLNEENQLEVEWNNINNKPDIVEFATTDENEKIINEDVHINWDNVINKPNVAVLNDSNELEVKWNNISNIPNIATYTVNDEGTKILYEEITVDWDKVNNKPTNFVTLNEENKIDSDLLPIPTEFKWYNTTDGSAKYYGNGEGIAIEYGSANIKVIVPEGVEYNKMTLVVPNTVITSSSGQLLTVNYDYNSTFVTETTSSIDVEDDGNIKIVGDIPRMVSVEMFEVGEENGLVPVNITEKLIIKPNHVFNIKMVEIDTGYIITFRM